MRILLSALSGILSVPYKVFVLCVLVFGSIWAAIFLEVGGQLGPRVRSLFTLISAELLRWLLLGLILLLIGYLAYEHGFKPKEHREPIDHAQ